MNPETGEQKIKSIRVDRTSDEGPSHDEVQFYWTDCNLERKLYATVVSAHCSGSSYLRVSPEHCTPDVSGFTGSSNRAYRTYLNGVEELRV